MPGEGHVRETSLKLTKSEQFIHEGVCARPPTAIEAIGLHSSDGAGAARPPNSALDPVVARGFIRLAIQWLQLTMHSG